MRHILIGTASWTDKSLVQCGRFYPAAAKSAEDRLRFYADQFPIVEVDSSYYAVPNEQTAQLWVDRTPNGFIFDVKAFRLFTQHQTSPSVLSKDICRALRATKKMIYYRDVPGELLAQIWDQFRAALAPLERAGKLGVVLFQFPPWFLANKASIAHIEQCVERMSGYRLAVEFRNETWFYERTRERTLAFERAHGIAHVVVDAPRGFATAVPSVWEVTSPDVAVVRLHGRNRATWNKRGLAAASERFNYLYAEGELEEIAPSIESLASRTRSVHVLLNTNYQDQGQVNARRLIQILKAQHADRSGSS
jgi:uncharacterized protein YecE (DUF72 family)